MLGLYGRELKQLFDEGRTQEPDWVISSTIEIVEWIAGYRRPVASIPI
jgi:hypothetical protein